MRSYSFLAVLACLLLLSSTAGAQVTINEVKVKGTEFIELYNAGGSPVDVTGWTLDDGTGIEVLAGSIPAGGFMNIATTLGLDNSGAVLELRDGSNVLIDDVGYGDEGGAPLGFNSIGRSPDGADTDDWAADWEYLDDSVDANGETPGASNVHGSPALGSSVIINELDVTNDVIEIYNPTGGPVDLQGYYVSDADGFCQITNSIVVPAGGYATLSAGVAGEGLDCVSFDLVDFTGSDVAYLFNASAVRIAQFGYAAGPALGGGETYQRCDDGDGPLDGFNYASQDGGNTMMILFATLGSTNNGVCSGIGNPPVFEDLARTPCVPAVSQSATVSVTSLFTDSANLHYTVNGGGGGTVVMALQSTSGDTTTWEGTIPGQAGNGDLVEYTVDIINTNPDTTESFQRGYFVGTTDIADVRVNDSNGANIYDGYGVRLNGNVTVAYGTFGAANTDYYMQDNTGGINVFKFGSHTAQPGLGDDITVEGQLDQFNGKLEISEGGDCDTLLVDINGPGAVPAPVDVATCDFGEDEEGLLVRFVGANFVFEAAGDTLFGNSNFLLSNCYPGKDMRIDNDTNIAGTQITTTNVTVVGIAGQFDSSSPYTTGYQLQPRALTDLTYNATTGVGDPVTLGNLRLLQNAPNPFSGRTRIAFEVPRSAGASGRMPVKLQVFDVSGRLVTTLLDERMDPGTHEVFMDAEQIGNRASGVYFYRLETGGDVITRKMMVVR